MSLPRDPIHATGILPWHVAPAFAARHPAQVVLPSAVTRRSHDQGFACWQIHGVPRKSNRFLEGKAASQQDCIAQLDIRYSAGELEFAGKHIAQFKIYFSSASERHAWLTAWG